MTNVREILEAISDFSDFVKDRALEVLNASGYKRKVCLHKIDFDTTSVGVTFQEDTRHDCPDYEYVELSISQLEMNDLEWRDHINEINIKTLTKIADELRLADERRLANKERDYLKLKQELGH